MVVMVQQMVAIRLVNMCGSYGADGDHSSGEGRVVARGFHGRADISVVIMVEIVIWWLVAVVGILA